MRMLNKPKTFRFYAGDYVLALVNSHGVMIKTYILLRHGIAPRYDWATGPTMIVETKKLGYSNGSIYTSETVRKLTETEVVEAKLSGLV